MSPGPSIFEGLVESEETKVQLARSLYNAPLEDEDGRKLYVKVGREQLFGNSDQRAKFNAMLRDVSKQIILIMETGEYIHAREYEGEGSVRWFKPEVWRGMFSSVILGVESVPNWEQAGSQIILLRSSKEMTKRQYASAIDAVQAFGNQRGINWTPPKKRKEQQSEEDQRNSDDAG